MKNKFDNKTVCFLVAINNAYKDEIDREECPKLEFTESELTEDFTAMLVAMQVQYARITGDDVDLVGFTHVLNRLAIQYLTIPKKDKEAGNE